MKTQQQFALDKAPQGVRKQGKFSAASIAGGVITLDSGRQIDLAAIERALKCIVCTELSTDWENTGAAYEEALGWAKTALEQFN